MLKERSVIYLCRLRATFTSVVLKLWHSNTDFSVRLKDVFCCKSALLYWSKFAVYRLVLGMGASF
jgi:hypothetical protein